MTFDAILSNHDSSAFCPRSCAEREPVLFHCRVVFHARLCRSLLTHSSTGEFQLLPGFWLF